MKPALLSLACAALAGASRAQDAPIPDTHTHDAPNGVVDLPEGSHPALLELFERYTRLVAPNGGAIHLVATAGVSDAQLVRAREVMRFYLSDAPGTRFGSDKAGVANSMADHGACLVMFARERDAFRAYERLERVEGLFFQDLYASETHVEGDSDWLANRGRDACLEEVFHLVQGAGIRYALPEYQRELERAAENAVRLDLWRTNPEWWLEGSSSYEYIISVIDVLYGLWEHDPDGNGESFGGEYLVTSRAALLERDPLGVRALRAFLPDHFAAELSVAPDFEGRFDMTGASDAAWASKARWLTHVRLTGSANSELVGNARGNRLAGNAGDNRIDGGPGCDTVVYPGPRARYTVERAGEGWRVSGDGVDVLENVERLAFADGEQALEPADCAPLRTRPLDAPDPEREGRWSELEENRPAEAARELLACFDHDADGRVESQEVPRSMGGFRAVVGEADRDGDGAASAQEVERWVRAMFAEEEGDED